MPIIASTIIEVIVFKFEQDKPFYLLLHRDKNEKIYPNVWQIVTGSIEKKEKATEAALRELKEETGFTPEHFWVVPHVGTFYDPGYDSMNLCPTFAAQVKSGSEPFLSAEHDLYEWLPYEKALQKLVWHSQKEGLRVFHEYIAGGKDVMTLSILPVKNELPGYK